MAAINESDKIHLTPVLQTFIYFNQPIELDESKNFKAALNELMTMSYSSPNVGKSCNKNKLRWRKKTD